MAIRILSADDYDIIRQSLAILLGNDPDLEVVGQAGDGQVVIDLANKLRPDIIIMDIIMPKKTGIDATRKILKQCPDIKVIGYSGNSDNNSVREMFKAGATGYISKQCDFEELVTAIKTVFSGQVYLSPYVTNIVVEGYINHSLKNYDSVYSLLTTKEREVLQLIAEGKTTKEIALAFNIGISAVEWRRNKLMGKLGIRNIANLIKYAIRERLVGIYP